MDALLDALLGWRELLSISPLAGNRHHVVWQTCLSHSRLLQPVAVCIGALLTGGALVEDSLARKSTSLRLVGVYVTIKYCIAFWSRSRRGFCADLLLQLEELARLLEPFCGKRLQELERARRYSARTVRVAKLYAVVYVLLLVVQLCRSQDRLHVPMWPWPTNRAGVVAAGLLRLVPCLPFAFVPFSVVAFYLSCLTFEIVLCAVLADAVREADTAAKIRQVAQLDVRLTSLATSLRDAMFGVTTATLLGTFVTPLFATVLLLLGHFDATAILCVTYVLLFITLCAMGQDTEDAFRDLSSAAYSGKWLKVDSSSRAVVLLLMCRRNRPVGIAAAKAVMSLNLSVCREAMNNWYKMLQVLVGIL